eukprot:TRINITY_DN2848_c0_g1_i1.p1 TRINITY_DN2848_c0_g1~~TRINITY_DN2848_c0_g1_i1.p1  ORF type:complete len:304 (-),score=17.72 TRINITY_DN2848_c0_g1_i1:120-1031(-)
MKQKYANPRRFNPVNMVNNQKETKNRTTDVPVAGIILSVNNEDHLEYLTVCRSTSEAYSLLVKNLWLTDFVKDDVKLKATIGNLTSGELNLVLRNFRGTRAYISCRDKLQTEQQRQNPKEGYRRPQAIRHFKNLKLSILTEVLAEKSRRKLGLSSGPKYDSPEFGFPKGFVEGNETSKEGALREFREEVGFDMTQLPGLVEGCQPVTSRYRNDRQTFVATYYVYHYEGSKADLVQLINPDPYEVTNRKCDCCHGKACANGSGAHFLSFDQTKDRIPDAHNECVQVLIEAVELRNREIPRSAAN